MSSGKGACKWFGCSKVSIFGIISIHDHPVPLHGISSFLGSLLGLWTTCSVLTGLAVSSVPFSSCEIACTIAFAMTRQVIFLMIHASVVPDKQRDMFYPILICQLYKILRKLMHLSIASFQSVTTWREGEFFLLLHFTLPPSSFLYSYFPFTLPLV